MSKKIGFLIFLLFFIHFFYRIWGYKQEYLIPFDSNYWKNRYLHSQWMFPNSQEKIGDDGLYAYAGWEYIKGANPVLINPEVPPLGKYLIGLVILIFKNQAIFAVFAGIICLLVFYYFSLTVLQSRVWALLATTLFSFEPLFYSQLRAPFLDLLYLSFLLGFLVFLLKERFFWSAIFLGFMAATKNTLSSFLLGGLISLTYLLIKNKKLLKKYFLFLPFAFFILLLTYGKYFLSGYTLKDFLGLQKYIYVNFYKQQLKTGPLLFGEMFFLGRWHTWWKTLERVDEWHLFWPLLAGVTFIFFIREITLKKTKTKFLLVFLWLIFYSGFLCFIPVWPRYFLLLLPFLDLSTVGFLKEIKIKKKRV